MECDSWTVKRLSAEELMLLNCDVGSFESGFISPTAPTEEMEDAAVGVC